MAEIGPFLTKYVGESQVIVEHRWCEAIQRKHGKDDTIDVSAQGHKLYRIINVGVFVVDTRVKYQKIKCDFYNYNN